MAFEFVDEAPQEPAGRFEFVDEPAAPVQTIQATKPQPTGMAAFGKAAYEGLTAPARGVLNLVGLIPSEEINRRRVENQYLNESGAGMAGTVTGTVAGLAGSGAGLKLAGKGAGYISPRVGAALEKLGISLIAPKTSLQAGAGGAFAGGILTPATSTSERLLNTVAGGVGGVVGQKAGDAIGSGVRRTAEAVMPSPMSPQLAEIARSQGVDVGVLARDTQRSLSAGLKSGKLTPEAANRITRAESLPVPVKLTKGAATRDFGQQQSESGLRLMDEGAAIRQQDINNNAALIENMELLGQKQRPTATGPYFVGKSVQEAAKGAEQASLKKATDLLQSGRDKGADVMVDPSPIVNGLMKNIDDMRANNDAGAALSTANMLKRLGYAADDESGNLVATGKPISATEAMSLYHAANRASTPNSVRHMRDVKKGIMESLEGAEGGADFKKGITLFREHMGKFDDPKAVKNLIAMSSDKSVRGDAVKAIRNMRGALVDNLLESSYAGQTTNALDQRTLSGANFRNAVKAYGGGKDEALGWMKIEALLGKKDTTQLRQIADTMFDATNKVPGAAQTSGTAERLINFLSKIPLLPGSSVLTAAKEGLAKQKAKAEASAAIKAMPTVAETLKRSTPLSSTAGIGTATPLAQWLLNPSAANGQ